MVKNLSQINSFSEINRSSGILLHPTSLPGNYGIGELGINLFKFIDLISSYNLKFWQILPLGPTGYGNSPYQSFSAFAGNPLLISIDNLIDLGLLKKNDLVPLPNLNTKKVNFGELIPWKWKILRLAFKNFHKMPVHQLQESYKQFLENNEYWLHDYALFMAIKSHLNNIPWNEWPEGLRDRNQEVLEGWQNKNSENYNFQIFVQFIFFDQWNQIKHYCDTKNVLIIGDIPIFVALDSADVWANRELFYIDDEGKPILIAGVPPDLFSETGQRWGNPLYKWKQHQKNGYKWWKNRFIHIIKMVDFIRLDHFRGFEAYWEINATEPTAMNGKWVKGPGSAFFQKLKRDLSVLPIIAENLGVITPEVERLRAKFNLPGMKILQFAFDEPYNPLNPYLPHNFEIDNVVYTGTHDNETIVGWFGNLSENKQEILKSYLNQSLEDIAGLFIRECFKSTAKLCIVPMQDVLRIDNSGRMNFPGKEENNWEWRFEWFQINEIYFQELQILSKMYNR